MRSLVIALLLLCQMAIAWAANVPLMPVRDLRAGMQGVGKTVLAGDTIEEFNVEILGVTGNDSTGYNIFVRLYGDVIERAGGVAQGMSGSPVYVDGRLVGAVAYGRGFNDPHYCFLTPIGSMLALLDEPRSLPEGWIPQGTALQAGGFTEEGLAYLQDKLAPFGLDAVNAGGIGQGSTKDLEPGSAVGASLMNGDMTLGALGTVTWTDDQGHVLAFGHPFMQRGTSNFFMNKAWVLGVVPNLQSSYKVGNMGTSIGKFAQDRSAGIGGQQGSMPSSIPLFVNATDSSRGQSNSVRVRIVDDEALVPAIVDSVVANTVSKTVDRKGAGTASLHFTISGVNSDKENLLVDRENMYYSSTDLLKNLNSELTDTLNTLMQNKLEPVTLYGIDVEAKVSGDVQVTEITSVSATKSAVKPGERVPIKVTLKPYRGEEFDHVVNFKVPKDYQDGKLALTVRGGSSTEWILNLLRKQKEEDTPQSKQQKKRTLKDYVDSVNNADRNNSIVVDLSDGTPKAAAEGEAAQADAGLESMLKGSPYKQSFPVDFIVDGEVEIVLNVKK